MRMAQRIDQLRVSTIKNLIMELCCANLAPFAKNRSECATSLAIYDRLFLDVFTHPRAVMRYKSIVKVPKQPTMSVKSKNGRQSEPAITLE